jgi:5-methylcytosine-specific restriction enzyme A
MTKLRSLPSAIRPIPTRVVLPPKQKDAVYDSPEFRMWRTAVIARAGGRCEAIDHGLRCTKARPEHRMIPDHIIELRDGGALLDVANGQCLCDEHHWLKTMKARARRLQNPVTSSCK